MLNPRWLNRALGLAVLGGAVLASAADMDTLTNRFHGEFLKERLADSKADLETWLAALQPDGRWNDIDYADTSWTNWAPRTHLLRLFSMAAAFRNPGHSRFGDPVLRTRFLSAYGFWLSRDPQSGNWWFNEINAPQILAKAMILMNREMTAPQRDTGVKRLGRAWLGIGNGGYENVGQNLIWRAGITIWRGCITGDTSLIREALGGFAGSLKVVAGEGIQADASFHQHGPQLYSGGYGLGFSGDCAHMAVQCRGTAFAFTGEQVEILGRLILDGQRWMMRGSTFDHGAMGREITRIGAGNRASAFIRISDYMTLLDPRRKAEFTAFASHLRSSASGAASLVRGNRHYWRSDFMVHHREAYYTSAKLCSKRTVGTEWGNGEGLKSFWLSDGATLVMRTGQEYLDIFPVWDWARIPGVTAELAPAFPVIKGSGHWGVKASVGGVSDSLYGTAAMDYSRAGVSARKSWFYFDDEFVCLGAGINGASANPVATTLNQCYWKGNAVIGAATGRRVATRGQQVLASPRWVHHDGVGYVFPGDAGDVVLKADRQSGSWKDINSTSSGEVLTREVFSLWIDHKVGPVDAGYQYVVVPGKSDAELEAYAGRLPVRILSNTPQLQAVRHDALGAAGIAFHDSGRVRLTPELLVKSDRPCLVQIRENGPDLRLAVANPLNDSLTVNLDISLNLVGPGAVWMESERVSRVTFKLPSGLAAGSSLVKRLTVVGSSNSVPRIRAGGNRPYVRSRLTGPGNGLRMVLGDVPAGSRVLVRDARGKTVLRTHSSHGGDVEIDLAGESRSRGAFSAVIESHATRTVLLLR